MHEREVFIKHPQDDHGHKKGEEDQHMIAIADYIHLLEEEEEEDPN